MSKKGFSLTEVMVTLVVIGVVAAIITPVIQSLIPNKRKIMFKKAYYLTERIVGELIDDDGLYPEDATLVGLQNTTAVIANGVAYSVPTTKFCQLFASKLNVVGTVDCAAGGFEFQSNDGIAWHLPVTPFPNGLSSQTITVDVIYGDNTSNQNPNCTYNASTCPNPDQFNIFIYNDGQLKIADPSIEKDYLGNTKVQN